LPLSERARIEVYLPDLPRLSYQHLLDALTEEFTYAFGGCTIVRGLDGTYLSEAQLSIRDRINLVYADTPYSFSDNFEVVSAYADKLNRTALTALNEEAILVVVDQVYHSELQ
jgi:hypothetical protein